MIAAVDIGGTKIAVGMVDSDGKVRARLECRTGAEGSYAYALQRVSEMLRAVAKTAQTQISGIGIGSTGPVYPLTGEFGDVHFFPDWKGENPVADLSRTFHVRVAIENDGDAAALAEAGWGAGRNGNSEDRCRLLQAGAFRKNRIGIGVAGRRLKPDRRRPSVVPPLRRGRRHVCDLNSL